ncbi:MAG TPA: trypsin-like peptidase domain-containing protein [Terriglobia bacterium]|nr:trypsin-like peptidase domain-containing protein [Terriglobia bacterium]
MPVDAHVRRVVAGAMLIASSATCVGAQTLRDTFKRVASSVAVVEAEEVEVAARGSPAPDSQEYTGSGFLVSADGKLLTAAHLVQVAEKISVTFPQCEPVVARVVASEPSADVALLQLDHVPAGASVARLGDSDRVEVGDEVFVVGAPLGISQTLGYGHISGIRRPHRVFGDLSTGEEELLQTDAAINEGDSGAPLFNLAGDAVGVVSFGFGEAEGAKGLNFVVSSNTARRLLLMGNPFWSGFEGYQLHGQLAVVFNLPQPEGILVERVAPGSPAEQLGLRGGTIAANIEGEPVLLGGDVILEVAGVPVGGGDFASRLRAAIARLSGRELMRVTVFRGGSRVELSSRPQRHAATNTAPALRPKP